MSRFRQQLSQKQQQKLSPLQIQQIKLLELTGLELEERISQELEENPALEDAPEDEIEEITTDGEQTDIELGDYSSEDDIPDYKLQQFYSSSRESKEEIPYSEGKSFQEYLFSQFHLKKLTDRQFIIGDYLIGCIDDDGYIRNPLISVSDDLAIQYGEDVSVNEIQEVLEIVQEIDPAGIGAVNLQNCLLLQLRRRKETQVRQIAITMLEKCFSEFSKKQYDKIIRTLNIDEERLKDVIREITSLNPRPGNAWESNMETKMAHITPDFFVENLNGELILSMPENIPNLRISNNYREILNEYSRSSRLPESERRDALAFVNEKIEAARWFIDAVKQRHITLQTTMEAIICLQRDFFLSGEESDLRPMILKDVANLCKYNIATISRVSNSKYVQTPFGVYSLKFFFSKYVRTDESEKSMREIQACLSKIVEEEDKSAPLTDDILLQKLRDEGYDIARRTVAKYREQLGIPAARMRKEL
ncbi:MAG: RNA polymerase factor sigma-54 [Dysgonamonadaceae bacterium]|jgi:RNA polymerase sigma-54 factor|nr:RNA polymerase factor sigma-54 [Dysgonamonadaceae bacterium]